MPSPETSVPSPIAVGEILRPVGTRGDVRVKPLTDQPRARFAHLEHCLLWSPGGAARPCRLVARRFEGDELLVRVEGFDSPESARALTGQLLAVDRAQVLPAPDGHFYPWELEGAEVVTTTGRPVGVFAGVEEGAAHPLWVIADGDRQWLLPAVPELVRDVSVAERRIVVDPPDGLVEL